MAIVPGLLKTTVVLNELGELEIDLPIVETDSTRYAREYREKQEARHEAILKGERKEIERLRAIEKAFDDSAAAKLRRILALGVPDYDSVLSLEPYLKGIDERAARRGPLSKSAHSEARYFGWTKPATPQGAEDSLLAPYLDSTPSTPDP